MDTKNRNKQFVQLGQGPLKVSISCHLLRRFSKELVDSASLAWPDRFLPFFFVVAEKRSGELP